jgi:hypothetical protein
MRSTIGISRIAPLACGVRGMIVARVAVCALAGMLFATPSAFAGEQELEEAPAPTSIEEMTGALERAYPAPELRPSLFPWIGNQVQDLPPFLADTKLYLRYRSYYFRRDRTSGRLSEAWAMGGSLYYHSGWLKEFFAAELEGFTSQPIVAPNDRPGSLLLKEPDQRGYTVLGVANGKLRHRDFVLSGYRQKLHLPFLNQQDSRMTPNTFEAARFAKEEGPLRFAGGYAWKFKRRNGDDFVSFSKEVGVSKTRGAAFGSLTWEPNENFHIGASGFVVPDILATAYTETAYDLNLFDTVDLRLDAQFTHQHTVGKEFLAGPGFDTWNFGLRTSAGWGGALLQLAFAITGDERRIESFYGSNPSYIGLMQRTFNQADEKALLVSLAYNFSRFGIPDLSANANFAQGWDGVVAGARGDAREIDFTLDYRVGRGWLESLWLRLRASWLDEEAAPHDGTDFRVILRYELPVI